MNPTHSTFSNMIFQLRKSYSFDKCILFSVMLRVCSSSLIPLLSSLLISLVITIIRNMLRHIEDRTPDLIITGSQSQTIPVVMNNCQSVPLYNYDFLIGTNPDVVLLVVNVHDEIEYIQKTIGFIDSICEGRVLYIVISPIASDEYWSVLGGRSNLIAKDAALKKKNEISNATNREVFLFDQIDLLCEGIIDYFSEE